MRVELNAPACRTAQRGFYGAMLVITLLAMAVLLWNDYGDIVGRPSAPVSGGTVLTVQPWKDRLQLKWDPASLHSATQGEVAISDGGRQLRVPLTGVTLRGGNIVYSPLSSDVRFELRTFGPRPQLASVRFIGTAPRGVSDTPTVASQPVEYSSTQTGTADRRRIHLQPRTAALAHGSAPAPAATTHAPEAAAPRNGSGVFSRMKRGLAKLWPVHHNSDDGGQR